jgi:hypothetical protein
VLRAGVTLSTLALVAGWRPQRSRGGGAGDATAHHRRAHPHCHPVVRVIVSALSYLRQRDWTFALLTLIVLGELIASIAASRG